MPNQQMILDRRDGNFKLGTIDSMGRAVFDTPKVEAAAAPKEIHIALYGDILAANGVGPGIHADGVIADLERARAEGAVPHLHFNTTGGDFAETKRIITAMGKHKRIVGHVGPKAKAMSGGFLIFIACNDREGSTSAQLQAHAASTFGCIERARDATEWCSMFIAARMPNIPAATIASWLDHNAGDGVYFDCATALRYGIVNCVMVEGYKPPVIPESSRPFQHSGPYTPAECECSRCSAKREDFDSPSSDDDLPIANSLVDGRVWNAAQGRFINLIPIPAIPASLKGRAIFSAADVADVKAMMTKAISCGPADPRAIVAAQNACALLAAYESQRVK